jgi:hypothetical protein
MGAENRTRTTPVVGSDFSVRIFLAVEARLTLVDDGREPRGRKSLEALNFGLLYF